MSLCQKVGPAAPRVMCASCFLNTIIIVIIIVILLLRRSRLVFVFRDRDCRRDHLSLEVGRCSENYHARTLCSPILYHPHYRSPILFHPFVIASLTMYPLEPSEAFVQMRIRTLQRKVETRPRAVIAADRNDGGAPTRSRHRLHVRFRKGERRPRQPPLCRRKLDSHPNCISGSLAARQVACQTRKLPYLVPPYFPPSFLPSFFSSFRPHC